MDINKREESSLQKQGFYIHYVFDESVGAGANIHTHGLETHFQHQDIQCTLPIEPKIIHHIFHGIVDRIKAGEKFEQGHLYDEIIQDFSVEFIDALEMERKVVLPDPKGFYPNDPLCQEIYNKQYVGSLCKE